MEKIDLTSEKALEIKETTHRVFIEEDNEPLNVKPATSNKTFIKSNIDDAPKEVPKKSPVNLMEEVEAPQIEYKTKVPSVYEELFDEECVTRFGAVSEDGFFMIENLFSELISDYQKAMARYNLGIGEEYSLEWGNISGSIANQLDLMGYLHDNINTYVDIYGEEVNRLLAMWTAQINIILSRKIDKFSPHLEGTPTTTQPGLDDSSFRIPTTSWVTERLGMNDTNIIKYIGLNKDHIFYGEIPTTITLRWEFYKPVNYISIDGVSINPTDTSFSLGSLNDNKIIHFMYGVGGKEYNKFLSFEKLRAYFYSEELETNPTKGTKDFPLYLKSGDFNFVYLYIPKDKNARLSVDNIYGGFKYIKGLMLYGLEYHIYRTVNRGLGDIKINYDKQ